MSVFVTKKGTEVMHLRGSRGGFGGRMGWTYMKQDHLVFSRVFYGVNYDLGRKFRIQGGDGGDREDRAL